MPITKPELQTTNLPKGVDCRAGILFGDDPCFADFPESAREFVEKVSWPDATRRVAQDYLAGKLNVTEYSAGNDMLSKAWLLLRRIHESYTD